MDLWPSRRIASTIGVLATSIASGCFLVAPSDDELLGGNDDGSGGGSPATAATSTSTTSSTASTGAPTRFCDVQAGNPAVRFCEDFDAPDAAIDVATWTSIPTDAFATATLVTSPVASMPRAAKLDILPGAPGCHGAKLERQLIGKRGDTAARPTRIHYGAALGVDRDGFAGAIELDGCIALVSVHGAGTTVGLEFQWDDGGFMSAYVDYPVETTIVGRVPRVAFTLDLPTGTVDFAVDGATVQPVAPFEIPAVCRMARLTSTFVVGPVCDANRSVVVDDVTFGAD